jgi:DNA-binding MarR family transcriptional regulator
VIVHPGQEHESWEQVDALSAEVFRAFIRALQLHRQHMFKALAGHGVHPGQVFCLRLVGARSGITQRDLASELLLARPTVTRMLQALERAGAVERRPDQRDQRLTRVYLTATGGDLLEETHAVAADYINQTIASLSEHDRRDLVRLLNLLGDSMAVTAPPDAATPGATVADRPSGSPSSTERSA